MCGQASCSFANYAVNIVLCVSVQWPDASQVPDPLRLLVESCLAYHSVQRPTMLAVTAGMTAILNCLRGVSFIFAIYVFRSLPHSSTCQEVQCSVGILQALLAVLQRFLFWSAHPFDYELSSSLKCDVQSVSLHACATGHSLENLVYCFGCKHCRLPCFHLYGVVILPKCLLCTRRYHLSDCSLGVGGIAV